MMDTEKATRLVERGTIEVAPIAFMRGRTLNDAFVILDEAQNTTSEQMKMFLTRLGFGSKAVVTGDITQIDLPPGDVGPGRGLKVVETSRDRLRVLRRADVVRHKLVQQIVKAYDVSRRMAKSADQKVRAAGNVRGELLGARHTSRRAFGCLAATGPLACVESRRLRAPGCHCTSRSRPCAW
jgi:phosphate starvation-inducible protein PhoH